MTRMLAVSIIVLLAACSVSQPMTADDSKASPSISLQQISLDYLYGLPEYAAFNQSRLELKLSSSTQDHLGMTHQRYQQLFQSVPLLDAEIITHIKDRKVYRVDGKLAQLKLKSVKPTISAEQAVAVVARAKKLTLPYHSSKSLVITADGNWYDRLAWMVTVKKGVQRYIFLIDARNATIIREIPGIQSSLLN
jgi:Zn-dependent metalloprotease